jgi:hypothetical protein
MLARKTDWPPLYDLEQLGKNTVKISSVCYLEDMYVSYELAQEAAAKVANLKQVITSQFKHNALRQHSKEVVDLLFKLSSREED